MTQPTPFPIAQPSSSPSVHSAAIQRCCEARDSSLQESRARKRSSCDARELGQKAFRDAMPDLCGYENIRDFIACVSYGVLTGDIHPIEGPQFLYAAQVAISALRLEPKEKKRPAA